MVGRYVQLFERNYKKLFDAKGEEHIAYAVDGAKRIERLAPGGIDVVLLDLALTDSTGLETLRRLRAASPWAPVVVVLSGLSDEEISFRRYRRARVELENRVRERTADLVKANDPSRNSQHLLQGILDNSTAMILVKDLQGQYTLVNHGYEKVFHANSESFVGKTVYDLLPPEHADRVRASDQRVYPAGACWRRKNQYPMMMAFTPTS
jgi:PAS domain-containing protein